MLVGSMALDLFAVFFGGAIAMLPVFATDILMVGPLGLGLLRTAPAAGALIAMLATARLQPRRRAGPIFLACVTIFGVSMIVFGLSSVFILSLAALFVSGFADGVSVVIRSLILRVESPEAMRGRIASVNYVFIGASNELGRVRERCRGVHLRRRSQRGRRRVRHPRGCRARGRVRPAPAHPGPGATHDRRTGRDGARASRHGAAQRSAARRSCRGRTAGHVAPHAGSRHLRAGRAQTSLNSPSTASSPSLALPDEASGPSAGSKPLVEGSSPSASPPPEAAA